MTLEEQEAFIVKRLKEERLKSGMTQMSLALESGVSQNMIVYIEKGKRSPTLATILKLCNAMKISPAVLFLGVDFSVVEDKMVMTLSDILSGPKDKQIGIGLHSPQNK